MIQVFPDTTLIPTLIRSLPATMHFYLMMANVTPTYTTTFGDVTASGPIHIGSVDDSDFTLESLAAHIARLTAPDIGYTNTSGSTVSPYGYFATTSDSSGTPAGDLVLTARFDSAPIAILNLNSIAITPTIPLRAPIA